jgi:hypothetical protein
MSTRNPTSLKVGMTGELDGQRYTVAGRVVFSTEVDGETYYWNEFNLVGGYGVALTLVFEEGEDGPEWKVFQLFEPLRAMTVAEAAAKKAGDTVSLDGENSRVTLVGQSRVVGIEGTAPEGVEQGDVANYWNADNTRYNRMTVASWTGDEIEFYKGGDITSHRVAQGFGLPNLAQGSGLSFNGGGGGGVPGWLAMLIFGGAGLMFIGIPMYQSSNEGRPLTAAPPAKLAAPALRLAVGARGTLAGTAYTVAGRAVVEVAGVGGRFERLEYELAGDDGARARLVHAFDGDPRDWRLLAPVPAPADLTPFRAAAKHTGEPVALGWRGDFVVRGLFLCRTLSAEGGVGDLPTAGGKEIYGFVARDGNEALLARWNETALVLELGRAVPEKEVLAALGPGG